MQTVVTFYTKAEPYHIPRDIIYPVIYSKAIKQFKKIAKLMKPGESYFKVKRQCPYGQTKQTPLIYP